MHMRAAFRIVLSWLALPALALLVLQEGPLLPLSGWPFLVDGPASHAALILLGAGLALWADEMLRRSEARRRRLYGSGSRGAPDAASPVSALVPVSLGQPRDVGLSEALSYIAFRSWGHPLSEVEALGPGAIGERFLQVLEAAAEGQVTVWGRRRADGVVEAVPRSTWQRLAERAAAQGPAAALGGEAAGLRDGDLPASLLADPLLGGGRYDHLLTSRADLEQRWPSYREGSGLDVGQPRVQSREDFPGGRVRVSCLLPVGNLGATRVVDCAVRLDGLESDGVLQDLGAAQGQPLLWRARAGAAAPSVSLPAGERRELLVAERETGKRQRTASFQLKLAAGDLPLGPGRHLLSLAATAERGEPLRLRLELAIDRSQQLTVSRA